MIYVNQRDYPDTPYLTDTDTPDSQRSRTGTVKQSGCGICAAIMLVDRLCCGKSFDMKDAIELSYKTGANHRPGTDYKLYAPALSERFGLRYKFSNDIGDVLDCLRSGGTAAVNVAGDRDGRVGLLSHNGHFVLAIAQEQDGRIVLLDPDQYEGKFEEPGRQGRTEIRDTHLIYCTAEDIQADCIGKDPAYTLFWRA